MYYWITFKKDVRSGTVEADSREQALARAKVFGDPARSEQLPYPASPVLDQRGECPAFCYSPTQCKNRNSCPQRPACSE